MTKTIIVAGYGPGISKAMATKFGREGYNVAIVARTADRVAAGAKELSGLGFKAEGFAADLGKVDDIQRMVGKVRESLGPVAVVHWNAYGSGAGDLMAAPPAELTGAIDVAVTGLVATVQAVLPDLRAARGGVLVTNGGFGFNDPKVDAAGVQFNAMGLSIANAAKRKLVGLLSVKLAPDVYVGEVIVTGSVKGTAFDRGQATLDAATVADKFWSMLQARAETSVTI